MAKTPETMNLPLLPLRGMIMFPHTVLHFDVGRESSVAAVERAMMTDQLILVLTQKDVEVEEPEAKDLYTVGTIAKVRQVLHLPGNNLRVLAEGQRRATLTSLNRDNNLWMAECMPVQADKDDAASPEMTALVRMTLDYFEKFAETSSRISGELLRSVKGVNDPDELADMIAANALTQMDDRRTLLETIPLKERLEALCVCLAREIKFANVEKTVQMRIKSQIDKNQKDYYLREQLKAIQEELGEDDNDDIEEYRQLLAKTPLNEEAKEKAEKEIDRLSRMMPGTPEITVSETYLDWIFDLPWGKYTRDQISLARARRILDEDHYGMKQVKERIMEYLAVMGMRLKQDPKASLRGPILCFVGPPGVGKTSIVKAVARAMGRKFIQMSLGGVRDEAEIFGHRRTYIGAIPGRVIAGMKRAESMNPVFLFDEIDKMGNDYRGDPASAMLEVLDGEQNNAFRDHYMEIPFDLSRVLFVTTANTMESIPPPLRDRMEIIEVPSYTEEEKLQIAKLHLVRKQIEENGLPPKSVRISEDALKFVIEGYTREAGVRTLARTLAKVVRKAAVDMLDLKKDVITVNRAAARRYLSAERFLRDSILREPYVGIANGLAYTEVGGEMLAVECITMPGSGKLTLTGHLGDVMKESGQAALSWVRNHGGEFHLDPKFHQKLDIHIHVPEGAVPKDGPSAGVTMATALMSALSGIPVRPDVAMTGEITLGGRVLPIGGVKEKMLAAYRGDIKTLILPKENRKDVEEIPEHIQSRFDIKYVDRIGQVIDLALLRQ